MRIWFDFCNNELRNARYMWAYNLVLPWKWFDFEEWRKRDELGEFLEITGIMKWW